MVDSHKEVPGKPFGLDRPLPSRSDSFGFGGGGCCSVKLPSSRALRGHCVKPGEKAVTVGRVTFFGVGETVRFGDIGTVVRTGAPLFVR